MIATLTKTLNLTHRWHLYSGRIFFGSMVMIFLTAAPLSIITANVFLLLVAIFSFYLAFSGWRYARNRRGTPQRMDWVRSLGMLLVSLAMASYGAYLLLSNDNNGITMLVFAGIGAALSIGDLKTLYARGVTGKVRIGRHLTMMLASAIATITAFLVVNFTFEPAFILWLAPTLVITPIIAVLNRNMHRGTSPRGMAQDET
ncbi:MAG: hypothetical protein Q9M35_12185 [Rhodothermus sp.]|nr:hypothetical protein [Rhodothermus sp.]